jgi:DNA polymerase III delta subunit
MLSVFFGNDVSLVRKKALECAHANHKEDTLVTRITTDQYTDGIFVDLAGGSSLFGSTQVVVVDTPSEDELVFDAVMAQLSLMQESINHFILIEGPLLAAQKRNIEACATYIEECALPKAEKFNAFALTDAFLKRDKKTLWLLLREGEREGLSDEQVIGLLFWQIKTLRLVEKTASAEEAGLKPFVYSKAKQALRNFKKGEVDELSRSLLSIYHDGHLGKQDINFALEQWVLKL